jgi:hypothetical protein
MARFISLPSRSGEAGGGTGAPLMHGALQVADIESTKVRESIVNPAALSHLTPGAVFIDCLVDNF